MELMQRSKPSSNLLLNIIKSYWNDSIKLPCLASLALIVSMSAIKSQKCIGVFRIFTSSFATVSGTKLLPVLFLYICTVQFHNFVISNLSKILGQGVSVCGHSHEIVANCSQNIYILFFLLHITNINSLVNLMLKMIISSHLDHDILS